jgi:hypothetical protein
VYCSEMPHEFKLNASDFNCLQGMWAVTVCRNNESQVSETDEVNFAVRIPFRRVIEVVTSTLILDVLSTGSMFVGGTRSDFGESILGNVLFSSLVY